MRVLGLMAGAKQGGAEAFFERLALAFGGEFSAAIRHDNARVARLQAGGVAVEQMAFGGALDIQTPWRLAQKIDRESPDIMLAFMSRAAAKLPPRFLTRKKPVYVGRLGGYYDLKYYRRCDRLVANTPDICDWIVRQGWPAERVFYLPNFVEASAADPVDRATLDTPAGAKLVLALGRLHANKAFDVLLAAMANVPNAYLWIAGEGPLERALRGQAEALGIAGRVRFLGWRRDTGALLAACDVLACPSRHEPLGNVVLEAWAQARAVVAAKSQGPTALVADGKTGLLVPVDDAGALAAALRLALETPSLAQELAQAGFAAYQNGYTKAAVVARYRQFFEEACG